VIRQSEISDLNIYLWQFVVHFHQAVLDNYLADNTIAYETGWNKYTEEVYSKAEWPEAGLIAPLVNDGVLFHVFSKAHAKLV